MRALSNLVARAAIGLALFVGTTTLVSAQATPIANGGGSLLTPDGRVQHFAFHVVELPDGSVRGHGVRVEPASNAIVIFEVTSFMFVGNVLAMAGPVTMTRNAPPQFVIGGTVFFGLTDEGYGSAPADASTGLTPLPPFLGNLTIQQIIAMIGSGPPPEALSPLFAGNIRFH